MVLVFCQVLFHDCSKVADNMINLFTGKTFGKDFGELFVAHQLKEEGEGVLVMLPGEAKTYLVRVKIQNA